ncbi:VgrG-related protein [Streptomyces bohaiensis]|uniref:VgrG-related protein n=1 Tax=Streptomyces bohaiensis TaxID=1431344 RepID=A0ABX1CHA0_9ACTN|nr:VgrG-related protein [Streptomyces bohaiensis]NJQ17210.1 VgrG-related protein [Streptomyces bohaiensis]
MSTKIAHSSVVQVKIDGTALTANNALKMVDGWVDQGIGVPAAFRLTFRDPQRTLVGKLGVTFGSEVEIALVANGRGASDVLLTGEVTGLEADFDGTGSFTVIRGYDAGFRLMRSRRVAAYRELSTSDIVRRLAGLNGVDVGRIAFGQGGEKRYDFIAQSGVTDWDFIARLADENSVAVSIDAKGGLQFAAPDPVGEALVLERGKSVLRLRASATAGDQVSTAGARGWDVRTKKPIISERPADSYRGVSIGKTPADAVGPFSRSELVQTRVPYDTEQEVDHAAASLAADVTSSFAELEVALRGDPRVRPGVPVQLKYVGEPFEGTYTVTSVRHVCGEAGSHYEAWANVSGRQWRSLYGLTSGGGEAGGQRLPGVVNALVTNVSDPLKQGRVKLTFPWLDDDYESDWARVAQWGGKSGGSIFPLDVNDEVLVAFDRGALDHPYVLGGLYNGRDEPGKAPENVPLHDGARNQATRHTLADRTGNRVDFRSRSSGQQGVRIATGDDKLVIDLDRAKTRIEVTSTGAVTIEGGTSVSVQAKTNLSLKAGGNLDIDAGGMLTIGALGKLTVRGTKVSLAAATALSITSAAVGIRAPALGLNGFAPLPGPKHPPTFDLAMMI